METLLLLAAFAAGLLLLWLVCKLLAVPLRILWRLLLNASAEHYLTIEDAVTAGEVLLKALG